MNPIKVIADILVAAPAWSAIAGDRASPQIRAQVTNLPCATIEITETNPVYGLGGMHSLDQHSVQVDNWAETAIEAHNLAEASRAAITAAGHVITSWFDSYEASTDPGLYCIRQTYSVWLSA